MTYNGLEDQSQDGRTHRRQHGMSLELGTLGSWWDVTKHTLLFISQLHSQIPATTTWDWVRLFNIRLLRQKYIVFYSLCSNFNPPHNHYHVTAWLKCRISPSIARKMSFTNGLRKLERLIMKIAIDKIWLFKQKRI